MSFSINEVTLKGNLGKDAENRFTTNNIGVTTFSLATTRSYKGKDGNWVNNTTWHNVVAYKVSDALKETLKKGADVIVKGYINNRSYDDKEGVKRYVSEIIAERIIPSVRPSGNGSSENIDNLNTVSVLGEDDDLPF